jgi:hypothetical protein
VFAKVAFRTPQAAKKVTEAEKMRRYKLRREFVLHFIMPANYNYTRSNGNNNIAPNASSTIATTMNSATMTTGSTSGCVGERASLDSGSFTIVNSNAT